MRISVVIAAANVTISVIDQGRGIPAEFKSMMFRQFSREAGVEADGTDGFGLGLSICKRLVEQMSGTIDYESKLGKGSRFFFSLPLVSQGSARSLSNRALSDS